MKRRFLAIGFAPAVALVAMVGLGGCTSTVESSATLAFFDTSGAMQRCTVSDLAQHNNDDPNQPYTTVASGMSGGNGCVSRTSFLIFVHWDDKKGVTRTARFPSSSTGFVKIEGTYSNIGTSVDATFLSCDTSSGQRCDVIAIANPA